MPSELRFEAGDIVVCVDGADTHSGLTYGRPYLVSRDRDESSFVHLADGPSGGWLPNRFRRARLDEIVEYAKTNARPFFKVGDLVTCVSADGSSAVLAVGQTYRVTDAYGGDFTTGIFYTMPSTLHQYLGVVGANGRRLGQSFLRFRKATPSEIEAFDKQAASVLATHKPVVAGSAKVSEVNEAVAIPADGQLQSQDGRKWHIGDWESASKLGEIAKVKAELIPCLPAKPVAAEPTEAPKTTEAPKPSEPVEKLYVGQQVVLSAKGLRNKELRKFLGGQEHAIIDEVRRDAPIWITRPCLPGEDAPRTAGRQTVIADEIVPVERDYYLVPGGAIIEKGDEWWEPERHNWRRNMCNGSRKYISTPLRRRKPKSLNGHSVEPNGFVKILGPSRELNLAPYWNPIMSNMIGKVFCVREIVTFATGLAIRIHDEHSYEWTLAYGWVSRPTESEIKAYQDSLAKVGNIVCCSSFDGKVRLYRICEVDTKPSGDVVVLVESETLVRHYVSPRALLRLATRGEALKFTEEQDDLQKAQAKVEAVASKAGPTTGVMGVHWAEPQDIQMLVSRATEAVKPVPASTITWDTPESLPFSKMELEFKWLPELGGHMDAGSAAWRGLQRAMKDKITIVSEGIKIEGVVEHITSSSLVAGGSYEFGLRVTPTSVTVENKASPVAQAEPTPKPSSQCPAEPGEGYRFLGPKELVVEGDEFWGCTGSGDYGWEPTGNHHHGGKQGGLKYRRRNKFTVGELVRIVKPLDTTVGPGWMSSFDRWINQNKVFTITEIAPSLNYTVAENCYSFASNWLAPASKEQKAQKEKEAEAKKAQIAELEGKMKDIQSQLDFLRK